MGVVLVTGATGNVGSSAVHALCSRGVPVRALVRDSTKAVEKLGEGVELMIGDFSDLASVHRALAGVDRLFLPSADGPQKVIHETGVIGAACGQGVQLIVKASTIGAAPGSPLPAWDWNGRIEDHLAGPGSRP